MMDRHVYQTNVSNRISIILTFFFVFSISIILTLLDIKFGDQIWPSMATFD